MTHRYVFALFVASTCLAASGITSADSIDGEESTTQVQQAEERYKTSLQAAETQFKAAVIEARVQFLKDVVAAREGAGNAAGALQDLPVNVPNNSPQPLVEGGEPLNWFEVPTIAEGAVIFVPPGDARHDGVVEFTVTRNALIGLAASWEYDGNAGGGWQEERKTKEDLADAGWIEVGKMYRNLSDRHTVFFRQCRQGESFAIRTRKYREPYVLVPGVLPVKKPAEPRQVDPNVAVEVLGAETQEVGRFLPAENIPAELEGSMVHITALGGVAILRVHKPGPVYVAASWDYDGNRSGQWTEEVWQKEDFAAHGWKEIGTVAIPHRGSLQEHVLFTRECNTGDRFRLRTRKYGVPYVFVPR